MLSQQVREKVRAELSKDGFTLETEDGDTAFYTKRLPEKLSMIVVRVSNRCSSLVEWKSRYGGNSPRMQPSAKELRRCGGNFSELDEKFYEKEFYSIVAYSPETDGYPLSENLQDEYVKVEEFAPYNASEMTDRDFADIRNRIRAISQGRLPNIMEGVYPPLKKVQEWLVRLGC